MLLTTLHSSPRMQDHPHRRFNPLTGEWILVSPRRTRRPWQGEIEPAQLEHRPSYDPTCYLCPGNERASGMRNPTYTDVFAFDNDFAALAPNIEIIPGIDHPLIKNVSVQGICRVLCFSPQHDLTLPLMATGEIRKVVDLWAKEILELGARYRWVQVFENKGEIMDVRIHIRMGKFGRALRSRTNHQKKMIISVHTPTSSTPFFFLIISTLKSSSARELSLRMITGLRWFPSGQCGHLKRSYSLAATFFVCLI